MNEERPPESEPGDTQPAESQPAESQPAESQPADSQPPQAPPVPAFTWEAPGSQPPAATSLAPGRPMSLGDVFDRWVWIYRKGFLVLLAVAAVIQVPLAFVQAALGQRVFDAAAPLVALSEEANPSERAVMDALAAAMPTLVGAIGVAVLLGIIAAVLLGPALIATAASIHSGSQPGIDDAYAAAVRAALPILLGSIVVGLAYLGLLFVTVGIGAVLSAFLFATDQVALGGLVILVASVAWAVVIVYVGLRWTVWNQAVVLEGLGPLEALGRSWRLVKGSMWRTAVIVFAVGIVTAIADWILGVIAGIVAGPLSDGWAQAIGAVLVVLTVSWSPIVLTVLFYDLRARQDGTGEIG